MVNQVVVRDPAELLRRADHLLSAGGRRLLGIAGPPGAGKSTLAGWLEGTLAARHGRHPRVVAQAPMDGFHLSNAVLSARGLRERKGAPETFDAAGYAALLRRIRDHPEQAQHAPAFSRVRDEPVPGAHPIPPTVRLVICEGNYLLLDRGPWARVAAVFDETWFVTAPAGLARDRLVRRHRAGGRPPAQARQWADQVDGPNAALVQTTAGAADVRVDLPDGGLHRTAPRSRSTPG